MLAFHGDSEFEMHPQPFDADAYEEGMELPIKEFGRCKELEQGRVKLYTRRAGYSGELQPRHTLPFPPFLSSSPAVAHSSAAVYSISGCHARCILRSRELQPTVHRVHTRLQRVQERHESQGAAQGHAAYPPERDEGATPSHA